MSQLQAIALLFFAGLVWEYVFWIARLGTEVTWKFDLLQHGVAIVLVLPMLLHVFTIAIMGP